MNKLRQINMILYQLKKDYGSEIRIRNPISVTDKKTGKIEISYNFLIDCIAIVLPPQVVPSFIYDLSYTSANRNFTYGGFFSSSTRNVIVDGSDLIESNFIKEKTEVIFENQVHILKNYASTPGNRSYLLTVTTLSSLERVDE